MISRYAFDGRKLKTMYEEPWKLRLPAFRVFGNLYFVGNQDGASWLLDCGKDLILFDTNYPTADTLLIDSIWSLGFDPKKITAIFHTHGHFDHFGATELLRALSGAKVYLGEADVRMFAERPELSCIGDSENAYLTTFEADVSVKDGDCFTFGDTKIRCVACPGHSPGATSYFFNVTDGERTLTACLHGGAGLNTLCRPYCEAHGVNWRADFVASLQSVMDEPVDIFLGNHTPQNDTAGRMDRLMKGEKDAFVDRSAWRAFLESVLALYEQMLRDEADGTDMIAY